MLLTGYVPVTTTCVRAVEQGNGGQRASVPFSTEDLEDT